MQPIDQSRSSSLINKKVIEFIEKKDPKPWAVYYSLTEAHTPLIVESGFKGKSSHGDYGDTILQMDAMVGKVLDMLDSSGQAENTLVYYTSVTTAATSTLDRRVGGMLRSPGAKGTEHEREAYACLALLGCISQLILHIQVTNSSKNL